MYRISSWNFIEPRAHPCTFFWSGKDVLFLYLVYWPILYSGTSGLFPVCGRCNRLYLGSTLKRRKLVNMTSFQLLRWETNIREVRWYQNRPVALVTVEESAHSFHEPSSVKVSLNERKIWLFVLGIHPDEQEIKSPWGQTPKGRGLDWRGTSRYYIVRLLLFHAGIPEETWGGLHDHWPYVGPALIITFQYCHCTSSQSVAKSPP